ncbi:MAG: hypothetical protein ACT4QG_16790 [Sporichthyaceae bacterium]
MHETERFGTQKIALWCNLVFVALTAIGWLGIAHFILPAEANMSAEAMKQWFVEDHRTGVIVGCTIFYIAAGLLTPGSIQFGIMLAKIEGRPPVMALTTAVCGVFISLIIFFNCCAWIVAAYRPENGADVIQAWNDWAWFAFLLGWIYLTLEMLASAVAELMDKRPNPMIPRWLTWYTIAGAVTIVTAAGPAFTKSGPFAYHGLLAFYLPVVIWGSYLGLTTFYMLKELNRQEAAARLLVSTAAPEKVPVG